jgi:hypothetical protein
MGQQRLDRWLGLAEFKWEARSKEVDDGREAKIAAGIQRAQQERAAWIADRDVVAVVTGCEMGQQRTRAQADVSTGRSRIMVCRVKRVSVALDSMFVRDMFGAMRARWIAERDMKRTARAVRKDRKRQRRRLMVLARVRNSARAPAMLASAIACLKEGMSAKAIAREEAVAKAVAAGAGAIVRRVWHVMVATFAAERDTMDEGWEEVQGGAGCRTRRCSSDSGYNSMDAYDWNCDECGHLNKAGGSVCARCTYMGWSAMGQVQRLQRRGQRVDAAVEELEQLVYKLNVSDTTRCKMEDLVADGQDCAQGARCGRAVGVSRGVTQQQKLGVLQDSGSNSDDDSSNYGYSSDGYGSDDYGSDGCSSDGYNSDCEGYNTCESIKAKQMGLIESVLQERQEMHRAARRATRNGSSAVT